MMAEVSSDAWACPKCSYENQDFQRCMGPDCDEGRPGGRFDTSESTLSTQPPSSGRRSTISVDTNHPAAAARQSKKHPLLDKSLRGARQRQMLLPTLFRCLASIITRGVVSRLVLPGSLHLLLSAPGSVRLLLNRSSSTQERIAVVMGGREDWLL